MNAINSNQYDEISDDDISDDEFSGFASTTKFPTTKFLATKFQPPWFCNSVYFLDYTVKIKRWKFLNWSNLLLGANRIAKKTARPLIR